MNTTDAGWKMKSIKIEYQDWGDYKGKYVGKIQFENRDNEAFMFNIKPDTAERYMSLIKDELVDSANHLGERLLESLKLLPAANGTISIEQTA